MPPPRALAALLAAAAVGPCRALDAGIGPVVVLAEVGTSGDVYPQVLPIASNSSLLSGRRVLFAVDHGVEDHEVYYQHQYFTARGAVVDFARPGGGDIVLSDFFNPSHVVHEARDLNAVGKLADAYDAVFVAGGLPSSSGVRRSPSFPRALADFVRTGGPGKLAAIICSGSEVLVESGLLNDLRHWETTNLPDALMRGVNTTTRGGDVVGSPTSAPTMLAATQLAGGRFLAGDPSIQYVAYPSQKYGSAEPGETATLVLGKNPNASPAFVTAIGKLWAGVDERMPGGYGADGTFQPDGGSGTPVKAHLVEGARAGFTNPKASSKGSFFAYAGGGDQITALTDGTEPVSLLQEVTPTVVYSLTAPPPPLGNPLLVLMALSSGSEYISARLLADALMATGAQVEFGCPAWYWPWKNRDVFLFSSPPVAPEGKALCDVMFRPNGFCPWNADGSGCLGAPQFPAVVLVPDGLFATNGVLRNDGDLLALMKSVSTMGGLVAGYGSGVATIAAALKGLRCTLATETEGTQADLVNDVLLSGNVPSRGGSGLVRPSQAGCAAAVATTQGHDLSELASAVVSRAMAIAV